MFSIISIHLAAESDFVLARNWLMVAFRRLDNLDGDTWQVSIKVMTDVTSKLLHEKTGQLLDRARQGERFRIVRDGRTDAFLIPATEAVDPAWSEIMADVWKAQKSAKPKRPNPVLRERKARNYAARLR